MAAILSPAERAVSAEIDRLMGIRGKRVPLLVSLGYPAGENRKKIRKSMDEMSSWNKY